MRLILDATEIWEHLEKCEVGDEKVVTFTVTKKGPETVEGRASHAEYADEYADDYDMEGQMSSMHGDYPDKTGKKGVPKAVLMISS